MPELPEVEVLVRRLEPLLRGRIVHAVEVRRARVVRPTSASRLRRELQGARFAGLSRRGKYLIFRLLPASRREPLVLLGHLGMTGRMYLLPAGQRIPKHAAVVLRLGTDNFVFEDTRYFGRLTLDTTALARLGPEPLSSEFVLADFHRALRRSSQPIKVKLLQQSLVAGIGNIYASEALFRAGVSPTTLSRRLNSGEVRRLWRAIRAVLRQAIACGSTLPLALAGNGEGDKLFYFGRAEGDSGYYTERLLVYDRRGQPCHRCRGTIAHLVQAGRSTYFCPRCQRTGRRLPHRSPAAARARRTLRVGT